MKKISAGLVCVLLVSLTAPLLAQDPPSLGKSHFTVELGAMGLMHRDLETDDGGVYLGLAGYGHLGKHWYLGGEIAVGTGFGFFLSDDSTFVPLELNAKRAFAMSDMLVIDLGVGLSYNRVSFSHNSWFSDDDWDVSDWVFGGQFLTDLYFKAGNFLLGLKFKFQLTEDVAERISPDEGWDYSNYRFGLQLGFPIPD